MRSPIGPIAAFVCVCRYLWQRLAIRAGSPRGRAGQLDYLVPGVLGLFTGAWVFDRTSAWLLASLGAVADFGVATVPHALGVSPWLVVILFAELAALVLYFIERRSADP